jgi:DNA-directed RNA polymerase subunit RPC12/RpoP
MTVFRCAHCGRHLTGEIRQVPLPPTVASTATAEELAANFMPARMRFGTYTDSTELGGFVLHPDDLLNSEQHADPGRLNGCCRLDGLDGPNRVCAHCEAEVATEYSDCWSEQMVVLLRAAVIPSG